LLNAAHSIAATATNHKATAVMSETADKKKPGRDTKETMVYDTRSPAAAAICQFASRFI
jgi:hypothetical protein